MIAKRDWYQVAWISHLAQGLPHAAFISTPLLDPDSLDPSTFSRQSQEQARQNSLYN